MGRSILRGAITALAASLPGIGAAPAETGWHNALTVYLALGRLQARAESEQLVFEATR